MRRRGFVRRVPELGPEARVREEPRELAAELPCVSHHDRRARRLEERRRLPEVLRVRPHEHGLPPEGGFQHVVAAEGDEAPADEDDVGDGVERRQLAHRVEHDDGARLAHAPELTAPHRGPAPGGDETEDLRCPLRMPGRDHQSQLGALPQRGAMRVEHRFFLALMRAPCNPHGPARLEAEKPAPKVRRARRVGQRLILDVASDEDALRADAEGDDPPGVLGRLHGEDPHVGEHGTHEGAQEPVTTVRAVGDPSVRDHDRDPARSERPHER